ncbi:Sec-independent protein translocase protein TatB [Xanthomonas arboricola pv. juglandis]|uniref:Sec-independent protein translocase protein TatB n=1 Tax=Xanthomonas TaxID=338 RepID=UPI00063E8750|nr:Sec-independent protein translocase protein TatB [Xanthomonas arboricola]MBB5736860.1 sec-independent protein translocase protein TatB [Xanthomonas sp. CFBP 8152]MDN0220579.1 Sec-independent protein translocase protein TatB [Xanthomonas arboricola pv. juglandis]MDN0224973.1 Sec-independent protein translocase protein TatB [Xanthomonas arboricola pv. juglandis]MDN0229187.1 Sec-independent protein translocase protein TatB [Xanthomonas arboricola pv. juglandis]MDN0233480.1 Sec-independent prot
MFDIGVGELTLIAIVALVVLGPERLPKAARFAGLWVRRARMQWDSVKQELERELEAEELKRSLQDVQASLREAEDQLRNKQQHLEQGARALHDEVGRDIDIRSPATPVATPLELAHADLSAGATAASAGGGADAPESAAPVIAQAQPIAPAPHQTVVPAPHDTVVPAPHAAHTTSAQTPVSATPIEPGTATPLAAPGKIQEKPP